MSCCGSSARGGSSTEALAFPHPRSSRALAAATRALSFTPLSAISTSARSAVIVCARANSRISPWPFGRPPGLPLRPFSNRNVGSCYRPVLRAFYLLSKGWALSRSSSQAAEIAFRACSESLGPLAVMACLGNWDYRRDGVDFHPAVFHVHDVGAGNLYVPAYHRPVKELLRKSNAHSFLTGISLRHAIGTHRARRLDRRTAPRRFVH